MGFLTRALIPSNVRRVAHPVRAVKRTVVPRPVRQAQGIARSVANPISAAGFALENAAVRAVRGGGRRLPSGYSSGSGPQAQSATAQKALEVQALAGFLDDLARVHEEEYSGLVSPELWTDDTATRFRKQVGKELRAGIPIWKRSRRAAAKAAVPPEVDSRIREMVEAFHALERNQPEAVLGSLEVAFDDNQTPAIPIKVEGNSVLIGLVVSDVERLLGNRRPGVTKAGNPSLAVWPKRDRNEFYQQVVLSDIVATAKEGFANAPGIETICIVVVRQTEASTSSPERMDAVIHVPIPRTAIEGVDWSRADPVDVLRPLPIVVLRNKKTDALESLTPADQPDIATVLEVLNRIPVA